MIARYSTLFAALCLITAAQGMAASAAAQCRASVGDRVVPRTPEGHPDLTGTWTNVTITPFQRSEEQESPVLTWEQVQERQGSAEARIERGARPSDPDRAAPRAGGSEATGSVGGYNNAISIGARTSPSSMANTGARYSPVRRMAVGLT